MRTAAFGVLVGGVVAGLLRVSAALACGASPPPFYVVKEQAPTSAATPLNAPLIVTLSEDANGPVVNSFDPRLTLTKAGSDIAIELKSLGGASTLTWLPVDLLEPETTYEAHFNPGYEGIPDTIWPFTTGSEATPRLSLSLTGQLEVTLEPGTDTVSLCPVPLSPCGSDSISSCTSKVVEVTKARVKLPGTRNGFAPRTGTIWLTDEQPYDFSPESKTGPQPYHGTNVSKPTSIDLEDPSVTEVLVTLPEAEAPYRPCFSFGATDARGDLVVAQLCLDTLFPVATVNADDGHDGLANDIVKPSPETSKGCSIGVAPASSGAWLLALASLALMRKLSRRVAAG